MLLDFLHAMLHIVVRVISPCRVLQISFAIIQLCAGADIERIQRDDCCVIAKTNRSGCIPEQLRPLLKKGSVSVLKLGACVSHNASGQIWGIRKFRIDRKCIQSGVCFVQLPVDELLISLNVPFCTIGPNQAHGVRVDVVLE